jgi:hypothetical protein
VAVIRYPDPADVMTVDDVDDDDLPNGTATVLELEEYAEEHHNGVRSNAVEELIRRGFDYEDLEDERDDLDARLEDLRRQLAEVRSHEDDVEEIVEYVETERAIEERYRRAGLVTRAKWWLTGMDVDDQE